MASGRLDIQRSKVVPPAWSTGGASTASPLRSGGTSATMQPPFELRALLEQGLDAKSE